MSRPPVLVVDDMMSMRRVIVHVLKSIGFTEIYEAEHGFAALSVLRTKQIGFVVSDWNMPEMDGLTLLKTIRSIDAIKSLPVLMLTAEGKKENIIEAVKAGASNYIVKPFTPDTLAKKVEHIFGPLLNAA